MLIDNDRPVSKQKKQNNALIQNGVAPERMETVGYGESRPISSNHAMNRRVEIIIVPIQQG